jgi:hypothetical protein
MKAFKKDAEMIKAAESALTTLMDSPLEFGATCTEANKQVWRLTRSWPKMLADHLNSILAMDKKTTKAQDDISDTLHLIVLPSNKMAFVNYHNRNLSKRILGSVKAFDMDLELFVVSGLKALGYNADLLRPISRLLGDYNVLYGRGREGEEGGGSGGGAVPLEAGPFEFVFKPFLSQSVWTQCGVW